VSTGNRKRRRAAGLLPEPVKCSARKSNGDPCANSPMKGGTVCRSHGGAAPQVKRKAQQRLENSAERMARLLLAMAEDPAVPHAVRLAAIRDALDRAGITAAQTLEVEATWQTVIHDIVTDAPPGTKTTLSQRYRPEDVPDPEPEEILEAELVDEDVYFGDEVEVTSAEVYDYNTRARVRASRRSGD
jgi:hypothetical protein